MSGQLDMPRASAREGVAATDTAREPSPPAVDEAVLIGLDWGTSSLRAYLFDRHGRTLAERALEYGIMRLPAPATPGAEAARAAEGSETAETAFDRALDLACGD
ncbi:MAG: 2-dehydro-3-deoxygalactonokinase, partial [Janthinobacterium lividum]